LFFFSVVHTGADLFGLLQLPDSCTSLLLGGAACADAAASVLVQLTQLDYLCVNKAPRFTDAGLLQLAALDLGRLYVYDAGLTDTISSEGMLEIEWSEEVRTVLKVAHALA
jgi:hypothetical protein